MPRDVPYLQEGHIHPIHIRPFFPINLDIDKILIHDLSNFFILKRLMS
jgi:hypothetical protein